MIYIEKKLHKDLVYYELRVQRAKELRGGFNHSNFESLDSGLKLAGLSLRDIKDQVLLLTSSIEGPCDEEMYYIVQYLARNVTPLENIRVLFSADIDTSLLPYRAISTPTALANHHNNNSFNQVEKTNFIELDRTNITHKFLCLARRPSVSRAKLVSNLRNTVNSLQCSFGVCESPEFLEYFKIYFKDQTLPIVLDNSNINNGNEQYFGDGHKSLFNIVAETSSQHTAGFWSTIFYTEKTYKSYYDAQIPLWFTVPGFVEQLRTLGFDMFDDIVDHSYDAINEENRRLKKLLESVKDLDSRYTLEDCQQLRLDLMPRFEKNYKILQHHAKLRNDIVNQAVRDLLE